MSNIYFTVGPTQIYPTVKNHLKQAIVDDILSVSHRGSFFHALFQDISDKLKALLDIPQDHRIVFLGSASESWERIIQNTVEKHSHHLVNGVFSKRFYTTAQELGKEPTIQEVPFGEGFKHNTIQIPKDTELLAITQCDTSTGVWFDPQTISEIKKSNPNLLIAVDMVSSAPVAQIPMKHVDAGFFSIQKGFGLPAGLGVMILSPQAIEKAQFMAKKKYNMGSLHNFQSLLAYADKFETPETPNVLAIHLLRNVLTDMLEKGRSSIIDQTHTNAKLLKNYFKASNMEYFVEDESLRSPTIFVLKTNNTEIIHTELKKAGIQIGTGYGEAYKNKHIRIANFPAHTTGMVKKLIAELKRIEAIQ